MSNRDPQATPGGGAQTSPNAHEVHRGMAPGPSRRASIDPSGEVNVGRPQGSPPGTPLDLVVDGTPNAPRSPAAPIPRYDVPQFLQSAPPANPDAASEVASLREANASLQQALRDLREGQARDMEELRLRMDMSRPGPSYPQVPFAQLAPGADPNAPVTNAQLLQFAQATMPQVAGMAQAQAIRAAWSVTPQEEASILDKYPNLRMTPEPTRTEFILRAHKLYSPVQPGSTTPAPGSPQSGAPQTRPAHYAVPAPEFYQVAPGTPDAAPQHPAMAARAEYDRAAAQPARTPSEVRARQQAMRTAFLKYEQAMGLAGTDEHGKDVGRHQAFKQTR